MVEALVQLKITSAVCSFFAVVITCFRLYLRRDRYWWDDACSFLSMIFLFVQIAAVFMHLDNSYRLSHLDNIAAYYIMAMTWYAVIWMARLAILYSVIRIDPNPKSRKFLHLVGVIFIIVLVVLNSQLFWVCEPMPAWRSEASPQCPLDKQVAICQLVTDILADLLLIAAPLRLIWHMSAIDGTRRRLMIIFSTSIVTTIVSLVHAAFIFENAGIKVVISANVENTFSLIVCNLPVVVTAIMRTAGKPEEETDHTKQSTFGWRVASRRTNFTGTTNSATARDITTVNLRDRTTNSVVTNPVLTRLDQILTVNSAEDRKDDNRKEDAHVSAKPQRSIVWITPEKLQGDESKEEVGK